MPLILFLLLGLELPAKTQTIIVIVSPLAATVSLSQTIQFTVKVTPGKWSGVTWRINGITGGNAALGTISSKGLYKAPITLPSPALLTVSAVSVVNPLKLANASVTVTSATVAHYVTLNWMASTSTSVTGYNIYRGAQSGGPYSKIGGPVNAVTFADTIVQSGQTYYYVATSVTSTGAESAYSVESNPAIIPVP